MTPVTQAIQSLQGGGGAAAGLHKNAGKRGENADNCGTKCDENAVVACLLRRKKWKQQVDRGKAHISKYYRSKLPFKCSSY